MVPICVTRTRQKMARTRIDAVRHGFGHGKRTGSMPYRVDSVRHGNPLQKFVPESELGEILKNPNPYPIPFSSTRRKEKPQKKKREPSSETKEKRSRQKEEYLSVKKLPYTDDERQAASIPASSAATSNSLVEQPPTISHHPSSPPHLLPSPFLPPLYRTATPLSSPTSSSYCLLSRNRRPTTVEEILTIEIKPGWKKGTKITFPEKGNDHGHMIPADLVFIIDEKPHGVFKRDGNDLIMTQKISLVEALTGYTVQLTTLDNRSLSIPISTIISPNHEEVVRGEGMPIPREPTKKGNLRIKFNIKFPSKLTSEQKMSIKRVFTS